LAELPLHPDLTLRTDSKYLIDGLGSWMAGWKRKGWRTAAGKPVLNQDLWQALDQARLAEVPLRYVKGHSGDPDNDRVDQIAVAYSKGRKQTPPPSASTSALPSAAPTQPLVDSAPVSLQKLLTRMELADRLASGGYALSAVELAQLVEQPLNRLSERQGSWRWRDWIVEPVENDRWRLRRDTAGSKQT
jgi:ribonuclease HI